MRNLQINFSSWSHIPFIQYREDRLPSQFYYQPLLWLQGKKLTNKNPRIIVEREKRPPDFQLEFNFHY
jgi:hypothetical protein